MTDERYTPPDNDIYPPNDSEWWCEIDAAIAGFNDAKRGVYAPASVPLDYRAAYIYQWQSVFKTRYYTIPPIDCPF